MEIDAIKKQILEDVDPRQKEVKRREIRRAKLITVVQFAALIAVGLIIFYILVGVATVQGDSMYPSLQAGERVLYLRSSSGYEPGDVVVIHMSGGEEYVKRVIAVAGDTVNIQAGTVYVNGEEIPAYGSIGETRRTEGDVSYPLLVGKNEVFVLGDNREISEDSRAFGVVNVDQIAGRVLYYFGSRP